MGASHLSNDQAAEMILAQMEVMKDIAKQINETNAVKQIEDAFEGVLERYHNRKIEELENLIRGGEPLTDDDECLRA